MRIILDDLFLIIVFWLSHCLSGIIFMKYKSYVLNVLILIFHAVFFDKLYID